MENDTKKTSLAAFLSKIGGDYIQMIPPEWAADTMRNGGPGVISGGITQNGTLLVRCNATETELEVEVKDGFEDDDSLPSKIARKLRSMTRDL